MKAYKSMVGIKRYRQHFYAFFSLALVLGSATGHAGTFAFYGQNGTLVTSAQNTSFTGNSTAVAYANLSSGGKPLPSSTDLLQTLVGGSLASFTASGPQLRAGQTYSNLADAPGASTGGSTLTLSNDTYGTAATFNTLDIVMAHAGVPLGYDITGINLYVLNIFNNTADYRNEYLFTLSYSTVGAPSIFIPLIGAFQRWEIADSKAGSLLQFGFSSAVTGVHTIRFIDQLGTDGTRSRASDQGTNCQEMDVFGLATVPEPSTYALLGLGLGGLCYLHRRRNRSST